MVRAFCEKPAAPIAERVVAQGALWNCFVMTCRVDRLLALVRARRSPTSSVSPPPATAMR